MDFTEENPDSSSPPSKTRRKQAMEELQSLGEALVDLPSDRLKKIALPEDLRDAVAMAQRMPRLDEARRRQMQFIGRPMRGVEPDAIRAALGEARGDSAGETARLHRIEKLREDLLSDEKVVFEIAALYPGIDLQHLRSLRRAALKEREQNKPPKNFRAIFQRLKEADQDANGPTVEAPPEA